MDEIRYPRVDPSLQHPFTCVVAGPTGCGKSRFLREMIAGKHIFPFPDEIVWCYGTTAPPPDPLPNARYVRGLWVEPEGGSVKTLIVVDDLMSECADDKRLSDLFTRGSHHDNCSVIFVVQNLFVQGREMRSITENCHYMAIFKNPRDASSVTRLAAQMYPGRTGFMTDAYSQATEEAYGYLFIDLKQDAHTEARLRTNIFADISTVFVPRAVDAAGKSIKAGGRRR